MAPKSKMHWAGHNTVSIVTLFSSAFMYRLYILMQACVTTCIHL